ncbi:MAG TPA: hypothetical protein VFN53_02175 [Acidobacteriaceae bacterium]|nr:hypothetical protein [Acidobacteriaceae bacterium]
MQLNSPQRRLALLSLLTIGSMMMLPRAHAASCTTSALMTAAQRDALAKAARSMAANVETGDVQSLRANTIPAVAADFGGIASSVEALKPLIQHATITVDALYFLDASTEPANAPQTSFYCGSPIVVLNIPNLPPGKYALAILHATGVAQPQQIALILSETGTDQWKLAGFFSNAMLEDGHDGLWYWMRAREYAQKKMDWDAWFYYQTAAALLDPVDFLTSPNMDKLRREANTVRPANLPEGKPLVLTVNGSPFEINGIDTTTALGGYDLEFYYTPNAEQTAQLRDPAAARKQVLDVMSALLAIHPELRQAFRGIWAHAQNGNASIFALDLPMNQIGGGTQTTAAASAPVSH